MRFLCTWASLLLFCPASAPAQPSSGSDPLAYVNLGIAQNAKGDYAGAIDSFNHALELNQLDSAAFEGRGEAHLAQGELTDAVNDFTKALGIEPQDEPALFHRSVAESENGDFAPAVADDDRALQTGSLPPAETGSIHLQRGRAKFCQGDNRGARADADDALKSKPSSGDAFFLRGAAENADSNFAAAADDFSKAAQNGLPEAALWFWLAKMEAHQTDDASTQLPALLAKALKANPDAWMSELGDLLQQKTTATEVMADLPTASAGELKAEQGWFFLAVAREFSNDISGARAAYQHVQTIGAPDSYRTIEAGRRLKTLSS